MRLLYIGAGFVGACSAAVAANSGHETLVYDIDERKIKLLASGDRDTIQTCLFEEGLGDLLVRHRERIQFTTDYTKVKGWLDSCEAVFMCLPTPEIGETGECNLTYYWSAAKDLARALISRNAGSQSQHIVIINKSTVPIGTAGETQKMLAGAGARNCGVASNPEFLVEGKAVSGSLKPDRIVVGANTPADQMVLRQIYQRFVDSPSTHYIEVNTSEAEASKLLANFYLFNRLAVCFDVIGRTSESFPGVRFENLRRILTTDARIGEWGFYDSLYAGGSCFIKDARSLAYQLGAAGASAPLVQETSAANNRQLEHWFNRAEQEANFVWKGKKVALLGLAFKRDTNDTRHSPSLEIARRLLALGVKNIFGYDPAATDYFKQTAPADERLIFASSAEEAVSQAEVIIISTDWPQFRGLADGLLLRSARPLIMDGRRMLQHRYGDLQAAGFNIIAVGSPYLPGSKA